MGKLRVMSGREVCAVLAQHGCREIRRRGSHIVMQKRVAKGTITVPVPNHAEKRSAHFWASSARAVCRAAIL